MCAFLQDRFSDKTFSAIGSKFAADFEVFVLLTLEKNHQISHSGPWSVTYHFGLMTFCKTNETLWLNVLKIFLIHVYKCSFLNILNTYRVFQLRWIYPLYFDFSLGEKMLYFYFYLRWVLIYSIIVSRIYEIHELLWKLCFRRETIAFSRAFYMSCWPRNNKDSRLFLNHKQNT